VSWKADLKTQIIPKQKVSGRSIALEIEPKFNYVFNLNGKHTELHHDNGHGFLTVEPPFSDYMQTPTGR
jgi:hypothetical protein